VTQRAPARASRSTPARTAPFRPCPGSHTTVAPTPDAQCATSSSSQTTATGRGRHAATTCAAMARTSCMRSGSDREVPSLRLAWWKALTGIRTTSDPSWTSIASAACCVGGTVALDTGTV
jgi:hypothetical protein